MLGWKCHQRWYEHLVGGQIKAIWHWYWWHDVLWLRMTVVWTSGHLIGLQIKLVWFYFECESFWVLNLKDISQYFPDCAIGMAYMA